MSISIYFILYVNYIRHVFIKQEQTTTKYVCSLLYPHFSTFAHLFHIAIGISAFRLSSISPGPYIFRYCVHVVCKMNIATLVCLIMHFQSLEYIICCNNRNISSSVTHKPNKIFGNSMIQCIKMCINLSKVCEHTLKW
jgi:hypothetical protein